MGKRKSSKKAPAPKKKVVLATTFSCLFCNHENAVSVKLDRKGGFGTLNCKVCGQHFQTPINYLSAPVDVYSDWIDACDEVAKDAENRGGQSAEGGARAGAYDDDDGIVHDDEDGEGDYGD